MEIVRIIAVFGLISGLLSFAGFFSMLYEMKINADYEGSIKFMTVMGWITSLMFSLVVILE